jgi:bifunctional non-homologous end joining protein LigD
MKPMLATRGDHVPAGDGWVHEVKWDGIRALVEVREGRVRITSRNENDVTVAYPELFALGDWARTAGHEVLLDGEIVALGSGAPSFRDLADRMHVRDATKAARLAQRNPVTLIAFDLLTLDGEDLRGRPLAERRERLLGLGLDAPAWQVPPTYDDGAVLLEAAEAQGLEGIVSKKVSSLYHPDRRSRDWLKFPIRPTGSFVVGGFRRETGSATRLGAVLVGEPSADGTPGLVFRGRVGSGIAGRAGQALGERLEPLVRDSSPFAEDLPRVDRDGTVWVAPEVVVDVQFLTLTRDGRLRQPAYRGVREDLAPADVSASANGTAGGTAGGTGDA